MENVKKLIGLGKLDGAIEGLLKINSDYYDIIIGVQGRLNTLRNKEIAGIISNNDATLERNGIIFSLLNIISNIEKELKATKVEIELSNNEVSKLQKKREQYSSEYEALRQELEQLRTQVINS